MTKSIKATTKSKVNVTWESVTPTRALLWLKNTAASSFQQRNLADGTVKRYIGEMRRGDWHNHTADIIRLGEDGGMEIVVDGQHRLQAIVSSQLPQDMLVARNVPLDAFKYIDQGSTRSLKDVMDCAGWESSPVLSVTGRYLWVYSETGSPFGLVASDRRLSAGSLFDWVEMYEPSIKETWERDHALISKASKGCKMAKGIMAFLWMKMSNLDHELAVEVMTYLGDPMDRSIPLPSESFRFAAEYISEIQYEMKQMKTKGMKTRSDEHREPCTSALIFAWNRTRANKKHKTMRGFKTTFNSAERSEKWIIA